MQNEYGLQLARPHYHPHRHPRKRLRMLFVIQLQGFVTRVVEHLPSRSIVALDRIRSRLYSIFF